MFFPGRDGIDIIGSSKTAEHALSHAGSEDFDLFILDLWLESRAPLQDLISLRNAFPNKPIMIYTSETSLAWKSKMVEEGVLAYITKTAERNEIRAAILSVANGIPYYPVNMGDDKVRKALITTDSGNGMLTPVQKEIINMLISGNSHKEIIKAIGKSRSTLEGILKAMRKNYDAKTNIELVLKVKSLL